MKVRMRVALSGLRNGRPWPGIGEMVEVPDNEGAELCAAGIAAPVAENGDVETATAPVDEERRDEPKGMTTESAQAVVPGKKRGRPRLPRDDDGNIVRESDDE